MEWNDGTMMEWNEGMVMELWWCNAFDMFDREENEKNRQRVIFILVMVRLPEFIVSKLVLLRKHMTVIHAPGMRHVTASQMRHVICYIIPNYINHETLQ